MNWFANICLILILLSPWVADAALSDSNINNVVTEDQWSSIGSLSYNAGTGDGRVLVAILSITFADSNSITGVTYGGESLTCTTKATDPYSYNAVYVCYKLNPLSGSNTFDLTSGDDDTVSAIVFYVDGADTTAVGTVGSSNNGDGSAMSATVSSNTSGSLLIGGLSFNDSGASGDIVAGGDTTEIGEVGLSGLQDTWAGWETADGSSETLNATASGADGWVMIGIEVNSAPPAADEIHYQSEFFF